MFVARSRVSFFIWMKMTTIIYKICLGFFSFILYFQCFVQAADLNYHLEGKRYYVDLTEQEIDDWYSELEICMLNLDVRQMNSPREAYETCQYQGLRNPGHNKGCVLGKGSNKFPCYPPYKNRKSFVRGIKGYTDASQKPMLEFMAQMYKMNYTVVFLGDSTMRQKLNALDCEVKREDNNAQTHGDLRGILPCHSQHNVIYEHSELGRVDVPIHAISVGPNSINCLQGGLHKNDPDGGGIYENAREIIRRLNFDEHRNVFIVANLGLWYNDEIPFEAAISNMISWLADVADETVNGKIRNMVRWHETMAQHWPNREGSGYYYKPYSDELIYSRFNSLEDLNINNTKVLETVTLDQWQVPGCCAEITNTTYGNDWRNELVQVVLKRVQSGKGSKNIEKFGIGRGKNIEIIPFRDVTEPAADMHVCSPLYHQDCTHYCYWPLMWQPFWHDLRDHSMRITSNGILS